MLFATSRAYASPDAMSYIKEITLPNYRGLVATYIPAKVEVRILIDTDGKTSYLTACAGKTISFFISYEVQGSPTAFAASEVRLSAPDQIVVVCHPLIPALDPAR